MHNTQPNRQSKQDKYNEYFTDLARRTAQLSYAERLKVGSVAVRDNRVILSGFNGMPPGMNNVCEDKIYMGGDAGGWLDPEEIESQWPYKDETGRYKLQTKEDVIHSEENLVLYAAKEGISLKGAHLYCTHAPCLNCARMIYGSGITKLYYGAVHRNIFVGLNFLEGKLEVEQLCNT
jgi:dCMP deaminase